MGQERYIFYACLKNFLWNVFVAYPQIYLKGALDNFSLIPQFFKKVEILIPLEMYTCVVTTCLILLTTLD